MCLALYLAACKPLPVRAWDPQKPSFHIIRLPKDMEDVRQLLTYPHVYYVGSHEGCSCAFNYEHDLKSIVELRDYLRKALTIVDEIEGFSCRPGHNSLNVQHSVTISPSGVALPEFFFQDRHRLLFRSRKTLAAQRRRPLVAKSSARKQTRPRAKSWRS
jgi:hypothetical protein